MAPAPNLRLTCRRCGSLFIGQPADPTAPRLCPTCSPQKPEPKASVPEPPKKPHRRKR